MCENDKYILDFDSFKPPCPLFNQHPNWIQLGQLGRQDIKSSFTQNDMGNIEVESHSCFLHKQEHILRRAGGSSPISRGARANIFSHPHIIQIFIKSLLNLING